jgi:hypothetical protein
VTPVSEPTSTPAVPPPNSRMRFHARMDLEERTLEDTLERTCAVCGARLTGLEIEAAREAGGPFLCSVHAAEELPAEDIADETSGEPD